MVCKIIPGSDFRGAISYNENKVEDNQASLLLAGNYPVEPEKLCFKDKLGVLVDQAALRPRAKETVLHFILSFSPSETLSDEKMKAIAERYMDKVGFGEQPYLVYRHFDAAHPHLHIVTTKIDGSGTPIPTFRFGKYKSNPARKEIEIEFGLVKAEDQKKQQETVLHPLELKPIDYGKTPTKGAISNVVRSVATHYRFASLEEFNAALKQFNVQAYRGQKDSLMYKNKGLIYTVIGPNSQKIGRPIKASSIYEKPTLPFLETRFQENKAQKKDKHKERLRRIIDGVMASGVTDKGQLKQALAEKGIYLLFRENEEKRIYGLTYVDNKTYCVFNGSDIDKSCSAKAILERLATGPSTEILSNRAFTSDILRNTAYESGFEKVMTGWVTKGMLLSAETSVGGETIYKMGYALSERQSYIPANRRISGYLRANSYTVAKADELFRRMEKEYAAFADSDILQIPLSIIEAIIKSILAPVGKESYLDYRWATESRKRRRRRN